MKKVLLTLSMFMLFLSSSLYAIPTSLSGLWEGVCGYGSQKGHEAKIEIGEIDSEIIVQIQIKEKLKNESFSLHFPKGIDIEGIYDSERLLLKKVQDSDRALSALAIPVGSKNVHATKSSLILNGSNLLIVVEKVNADGSHLPPVIDYDHRINILGYDLPMVKAHDDFLCSLQKSAN